MKKITPKSISGFITKRDDEGYKNLYGKVLIVAGNEMYGGAGILAAQGAVYSGDGLTTLASHPVNRSALHARLPECMFLDWTNHDELVRLLPTFDTVLIGPGLGLDGEAYRLMEIVLNGVKKEQNLIIDGDGITLYAKEDLPKPLASLFFTPHAGEWERLVKCTPDAENNLECAEQLQAVVILKGHRTKVYASGEVWLNMYGSAAMAIGGMGDTLAGIIAGLMKQACSPLCGVLAGVFFHSYIGDILAKKHFIVLPSDIPKELPYYLKIFSEMSDTSYP
ncbi:NAD(P)H-hydrate dehydratase [Listeria valentina]|uniref:NAD(P)H-hydrate dehydratase n=1 Tax=Listeria valentina TaxID=2705293 RepID=UPI00143038F3|nr:NAD(P)H-hydrate dehydratase [Listeria valentina]